MQTSPPDQEKLLQQTAVRQVSVGKGSAFFNLLILLCLTISFTTFYILPLILMQMFFTQADWLGVYLRWSPPVIVIVACLLYGFLRRRRLKPAIERLRQKLEKGESIW